jgi:hypothetical protein
VAKIELKKIADNGCGFAKGGFETQNLIYATKFI